MSTFEQLECQPEMIEMLQRAKIHQPSATQSRVIPQLRTGRHMVVAAETGQRSSLRLAQAHFPSVAGGGKTLAYLVPLLESLLRWKSSDRALKMENAPFAIILAPTRELVVQIEVSVAIPNRREIRTIVDRKC